MSEFCAIQELCSFEGSEASPLVVNPPQHNFNRHPIPIPHSNFRQEVASPVVNIEDHSPTIEGLTFDCDLDTIMRKKKRSSQEALLVYKTLKNFDFFREFKQQYSDDLRTTEALIHLSKTIRYEYFSPKTVIYKKGDISNQRVYLVYSGEVNCWVGKPDLFRDSKNIFPEKTESTCNSHEDSLQMQFDKKMRSRNTKRRQSRKDDKIKRLHSIEQTKEAKVEIKPQGLKRQLTFDGGLNRSKTLSLSHLPFLKQNSTHSQSSEEENYFKTRLNDNMKDTELSSRSELSNKSPHASFLSHSISCNQQPDDVGHDSQDLNADEEENKKNKHPHFTLRKINVLQRSHTENLETLFNHSNTEGGYIRETIRKGGHFGDSILKVNQPREETLVTSTACELLIFSLETFEYLLTRFEKANTQVLNYLLDFVPGLEEAIHYKKIRKPDLFFKEETYQLHNHIVIEGEKGKKIYLLCEGTCEVFKSPNGPSRDKGPRKAYSSAGDVLICAIKPGVFIGEEVMFNQESEYEYTVKAASAHVKVLSISAFSFRESMPKLANSTLETLYTEKKQKNMEIMGTRFEMSKNIAKMFKLSSPRAHNSESKPKIKALDILEQVVGPRESPKNNRFSARSYLVNVALPNGQNGSHLLEGLKFNIAAAQGKGSQERCQILATRSEDKQEVKEEVEEKLSEQEKKLRRYYHQGTSKEKSFSREKITEVKPPKLKSQRSYEQNSDSDSTIQRISLLTKNRKMKLEKILDDKEKLESERQSNTGLEGYSNKRLNQLYAFVSPRREKFIGFMPTENQKNTIFKISKSLQTPNMENLPIKVNVDVKAKKVTYRVGSVKNHAHNTSKSQSFYKDLSSLDDTLLSIKTAAMSQNEKRLKFKLNFNRKTTSPRGTPGSFCLNFDFDESKIAERNEILGRMSCNSREHIGNSK